MFISVSNIPFTKEMGQCMPNLKHAGYVQEQVRLFDFRFRETCVPVVPTLATGYSSRMLRLSLLSPKKEPGV
jgi:hypothetical protein